MTLLEAHGLTRAYRLPRPSLLRSGGVRQALTDVSVTLPEGGRVGIVGESGAGKSTLLRLLLGLEQPDAGTVRFRGRAVTTARDMSWFRREVQVVLQDPYRSLDPRMRVRDIIAEPLECLRIDGDNDARVAELLAAVGLDADAGSLFPHQFSGGQRQRIAIARALAPRPAVLIGDEPFSALDATVRADILRLVESSVANLGLSLILVSHDLGVVRRLCDEVLVLCRGEVVEHGRTADVLAAPAHPYTRALIDAVPRLPPAGEGHLP
ncbi:MAG: ATP-binding cassette domain-containing protein [Gordonia sp. (in: high G+C Gram-positive bacteria)]